MVLYVTVIFKPLIPIITDAFEHTFAEAIHIATVHAIYGENHLQKELSNTADSDRDKSQNTLKGENLISVHICPTENNYVVNLSSNTVYVVEIINKIEDIFPFNEAPPPKFS